MAEAIRNYKEVTRKMRIWRCFWLFILTALLTSSPVQAELFISEPVIPAITDAQGSALNLIEQGRTLFAENQFDQAVVVWQRAEIVAERRDDRLQQARILTYLSQAYQKLNRWSESALASQVSLSLLDVIEPKDTAAYAQLYAQALNAQGTLEFSQGQMDSALETWRRSANFYKQAGDSVGVSGSLINQSQAMEVMGFYRRSCSTLLEALSIEQDCYSSEVPTLEEIVPTFKNHPDARIKVLGLRSLGNSLRLLGAFEASQEVLQASLATAVLPQDVSLALLALADTQQGLYTQHKAWFTQRQSASEQTVILTYGQQALEMYQKAANVLDGLPSTDLLRIQAQLRQLSLLLSLRQWQEAQNSQANIAEQQALDKQIDDQVIILRNSHLMDFPASQPTISALLSLVKSWAQLGEDFFPESVTYAEKALSDAEMLDNARARSQALGTLGHLYEEAEPRRAQQFTEAALGVAQAIQAEDIIYRWQWQLGRLYQKQQNVEAAISAYQASVSSLNTVRQSLMTTSPNVQLLFLDEVEQVYQEATRLLLSQDGTTEQIQIYLRDALETMDRLQLAQLENFLSCQLEDHQAVALTRVISPTEDRERHDSVDPNAAVIRTILFSDRLDLVLAMPAQPLRHYSVPNVSYAEVIDQVERLRAELREPDAAAEVRAVSSQLYDWLIKPLAADLKQASNVDTLVFILAGPLQNVPMGVLYDYQSQQYLIEQYAIALTPGLELIDPQPLSRETLNILAAGVSKPLTIGEERTFSELPNVEVELQRVKSVGVSGKVLLNQAFTQAHLRERMRADSFSVVHIATHGQFSADPEKTFILTYEDLIRGAEFRDLIYTDVEQHRDAIELLVLSACQSAVGDKHAALGLAGIAVGAGARSTLATLWQVSDRSTASLMTQFYQTLVDQPMLSKGKALQLSQLSLLNQSRFKDPYYWAPFVLVGNWL